MKQSIVIIAPVGSMANANALCAELGWGNENFLVALSADGTAPASHYGLRASESPDFADALQAAIAQDPALSAELIVDMRPDTSRPDHFDSVAAQAGLQRVEDSLQP